MAHIHTAPPPTKAQQLGRAAGQRGTPRKMLGGSWISDLAALKKALVLCTSCERKFNPKSFGYVFKQLIAGYNYVIGDCDGCGHQCQGKLYLPERGN